MFRNIKEIFPLNNHMIIIFFVMFTLKFHTFSFCNDGGVVVERSHAGDRGFDRDRRKSLK